MITVNKYERDLLYADARRRDDRTRLNTYFNECFSPFLVTDIREQVVDILTPAERRKRNTLTNRIPTLFSDTRMGFINVLHNKKDEISIPFILTYKDAGNPYLKLPGGFQNRPKEYIQQLIEFNVFILVSDGEGNFSNPILMETILKYWPFYKSDTPGNTNRLQFTIPISTIDCYPLSIKSRGFFEVSFLQSLFNLFDRKEK